MKRGILLTVVLVIIIVFSVIIVYFNLNPVEVQSYGVGMHLKIANYTGMNVGTDKIYFGTINLNKPTRMERTYMLRNPYNESRAYVTVESEGEIQKFILGLPEPFVMKAADQVNVTISASTIGKENLEMGDYNGSLVVSFRRIR